MIIDERRSPKFRNVVASLEDSGVPERSTPDQVDSALDRLLIADAMAQMSVDHRAVVERSYYRGWSTAQIAADLDIAEGTVKSRLHYGYGPAAHSAGDGSDPMTLRMTMCRAIQDAAGFEYLCMDAAGERR